ncbi:hypothetical protein ASPWEDRAFT_43685 [Aspergillus wentii DTO 134E9]|uniref:Short-chain dehydrogenase/reductase 3 n=1 Tax=Aspergillus wentii DTO 134E9 TaxID=1073089 RepID=A0A1L9RA01_ASPWE|nr:uncharacterized protein ASPWEDRAFT_44735 [Aspergillus wentii DTO 134E9]XP_040685406.1 uncharacterized protein ASPWEDRAFT_43685 [Aspergillus wentii DTO 134E9]OJJ30752.1 hypothetical protein ASPWEDRAFT_44735 [Aspergillus wentii DTO 134E9]OJJ31729.1 hypothetical protein ASPWEDRAFT_43685 [Aspergillus wentii DTO 134E9]
MTGFTADVFGKFLQSTIFDPWKIVPLFLCAQYTTAGSEIVQQYPQLLGALKVLLPLAVGRRLNAWLSRRAVNNGVSDKYDWSREVIVLTGGSNGIGKQIADRFGARGIKVAILDIQPPTEQLPQSVHFHQCDITSPSAIAAAAKDIRATLGEPTILINNAGVMSGRTLLNSTEAQTRLIFEVNTMSHYWLSREFLPSMIANNHGMVVTVASHAGYTTTPNMVDYSATKAASIAFHEGISVELATRYKAPRVRTVLVTPGFAQTTLIKDLTPEDSWIGPLLHPETVADQMVEQVLTGQSGHVNLPGSAGWIARCMRASPLWFQCAIRKRLERRVRAVF